MSSGFFCWKAETISYSIHGTKGSNFDVSNDVWASQQYQKSANNFKNQQPTMSKTSHQINGWPPTISLVNYFLSPPSNSSTS
jgi:hypothetical protein